MASQHVSKIFVIGGTGVQGVPIVKALVADKKYQVRVLTRDTSSRRANDLLALGNVELLQGTFANESTLRDGFRGCDGAFVNIDGFNTGEKTEMYWAIRTYEIAIEEGIKFFVYGSIPYVLKIGGYDSKFNAGHMNGKGRIGQWILSQNIENRERMGASLFTVGPYIDMTIGAQTPMTPTIEDGVITWRVPLGDGLMPLGSLEDCGHYVRWQFDNPERANGMDLITAIAPVGFNDLAVAFEHATGHQAQYIDVSLDEYWEIGALSTVAHFPAGSNADPNDRSTMTVRQNFTGFWNAFKHNLWDIDYALLDEIHPNRVKSAEDWFRSQDKEWQSAGRGSLWDRVQPENIGPVLKRTEDGRMGAL
ncbi:nadp-binding [Trichoderma arundinaceum]|uniref:Nadp-binding n=1 Tax=Trichoderma arundinaceum TaxID=490622 RepID=A0A395NGG3_TRIAR|nr:nadp-binding [Trichoderma arundinaceum]